MADDFEHRTSEELRKKHKQFLAEAERFTSLARQISHELVLRDIAVMDFEVGRARREAGEK